MVSKKFLNTSVSLLVIISLLFGGITQANAQSTRVNVVGAPSGPTDGTKVPHYFGPYPNWANSPLTLPNATVEIQGNGTGAKAVAQVDPVTQGIASIQVTSPGSGYTNATVIIHGGNNDAAATATINISGITTSVNVDVQGGGYITPQVTFSGGGATLDATGTAYGGVDAIAITDGGSGYTMPTVDFNLPDAPDGVTARGHIPMIANGDPIDGMDTNGTITAIVIDEPGSGYLAAPEVAIHNGTMFDPIAGATPATVSTTLKITSVTVDTFGSGYTSAPLVTLSDSTGGGTGASATAVVDIGGVTSISVNTSGSGYLTVGMRKFIDDLPGLCVPPACPTTGKYIPLAVPEVKTYNGVEADEYQIGLVQYRTSFSSDLPPTLVRGYVQLESASWLAAHPGVSQHFQLQNELLDGTFADTGYFGVTSPQWLGPTIGATRDRPVRIVFRNLLPEGSDGDLFLPTDSSMMGSGMGPMDMMAPMNDGTVTDGVRNPACSEYPKGADCFKDNRATLHLHGGTTPWISDGTAHQWITPAGENTPWPQGVGVQNVPDMSAAGCDGATDGCMTFYYTNQQSARLLFYHDHAWGITRLNVYAGEAAGYLITDNTEKALLSSGTIPADQIPLIVQDRTFVPDAAQLALQDPTWDAARWGSKGSFWYHHVYMPAQNPGDPSGMSAYGRWMYGPWFWPPAADTVYGPIDNPYYNPNCNLDDPTTWQYQTDPFCEPKQIPGTPNISVGMEQFNDTPIVNGVAYPKVTLEPKSYRLRMLNAANDRFFNFQWYVADPTQGNGLTEVALNPAELAAAQNDPNVSPTPVQSAATAGPDWIQIGTEGGFLPAPAVVDGQQPTTWITDPTRFDVGNVDKHSLLLAPAERADVIVDFSKFAGKTLILYNDAPAAFPARVSTYDYYTGAPDLSPVGAPTILPGYGPNTRTIMQVTISTTSPAPAFNLTKLQNAFKHNINGTGVFESGQHPIIVGQAAYNAAYGTNFAASSNCNTPGSTLQRCDGLVRVNDTMSFGFNTLRGQNTKMTMPLQPKAIHDEMNSTTFDEYGRMQANLGVEAQPPSPGAQNVTLYPFVNPATELIDATNLPKGDINVTAIATASDGTQIWRITHNGVDTHPIHFHLYDVQLVNRVTWDNIIIPTEPSELGWKDTVRVSPLEDTIVALRPIIPTLPWEIPNSIRNLNPMMPTGSTAMFNNILPNGNAPTNNIVNQLVNFGWEYVYHCHILSHEEMDMMRPVSVAVPPVKPDGLIATVNGSNEIDLVWNDNSIAETAYVVQRETNGSGIWENVGTVQSPLDQPNTTGVRTLTDTNADPANKAYKYRVLALNTVGYGSEFPTMTVQSISNVFIVTDTFTVSGTVSANGSGASIAFTGGVPVTADINGNYSFRIPSGWTGTITPSLTGYTFSPASTTIPAPGVTADLPGQDFTTIPNTYTVSGALGVTGATVAFSGTTSGSATVTGSGYSFSAPYGWTGTITPSLTGYTFSPASITISAPGVPAANLTNQDFTAALNTYTVSGALGVTGATVAFSGTTSGSATVTGSSYSFSAPYGWTGTITPSLTGYTFSPASITISAPGVPAADLLNQNFTPIINTYTLTYTAGPNGSISGVTPQTVNHGTDGTAVSAVPNPGYHFVDWSDGSTANPRTDANVSANISVTASFAINTYTLSYTAGSNGSISGVTPQTVNHGADGTAVSAAPNPGYHFVDWSDGSTANPRTDANVSANISVTANFAINTYTLSYTAGSNGSISGISSQTVNYGAGGTAVSAVPNPGYHFVDWSDGSTTNPRTDANVSANISVTASFAINTYTISGGLGTPDATVTYTGATSGTATISGSSYSITVPYGWTGTIKPSKIGYTFTPASIDITSPVTGNLINQDFSSAINVYFIHGTVGTTGATVTYTGTTSGSATVINSSYFFMVPYGWTGRVTAFKARTVFSPSFRTYTNVIADQVAQNFTASSGATIDVTTGGAVNGSYSLPTGQSTLQSYAGLNNGPMKIASTNGTSIIASQRVAYNNGTAWTSFSEMMGLPAQQATNTYWFPWYNNVDLDTQIRVANASASPVTVTISIGGVAQAPISLAIGQSTSISYPLNNGPVKVQSVGGNIAASMRVAYFNGTAWTSFSEVMGVPSTQLSRTYWFPWYNNVDLNSQIRFANVSASPVTVTVTIGGAAQAPISLAAGQSTRISYPINNGPVQVQSSGGNIIASMRVAYNNGAAWTSFSEVMGMPSTQLTGTYWFPWYNNIDLNTQIRIANPGTTTRTVTVTIGGVAQTPITLAAGQSTRVSYPINSGPVRVQSSGGSIIASMRVAYFNGTAWTSFSEVMGLPDAIATATTSYLFPWYNNVDMNTQVRFAVP